jgi:hypothetical protein
MLGPAHGAVLFAPAEDAFDHRAARLRHAVAGMVSHSGHRLTVTDSITSTSFRGLQMGLEAG